MLKKDSYTTKDMLKQTAYEKACLVSRKNNKPICQKRRGSIDYIMALDEMQENQNKWIKELFFLNLLKINAITIYVSHKIHFWRSYLQCCTFGLKFTDMS